MKTSFDEIRKIASRALDGAGAPPGLDEDGGWACAWLEAAGYPGLRMLADLLDRAGPDELSAGLDKVTGARIDAKGRSAVCFGSLISEYAAGQGKEVSVHALRDSAYVIPHLANLAKRGVQLSIDPVSDVMVDLIIRPEESDYATERARVAAAIQDGIEVTSDSFSRVYAYSRAILVPQTDASLLSGAGAGLTDND